MNISLAFCSQLQHTKCTHKHTNLSPTYLAAPKSPRCRRPGLSRPAAKDVQMQSVNIYIYIYIYIRVYVRAQHKTDDNEHGGTQRSATSVTQVSKAQMAFSSFPGFASSRHIPTFPVPGQWPQITPQLNTALL